MTCNPFPYFKSPATKLQAQSNVNYWWFEGMGECPPDTNEASWNTFIRESKREAKRQLAPFLIDSSIESV